MATCELPLWASRPGQARVYVGDILVRSVRPSSRARDALELATRYFPPVDPAGAWRWAAFAVQIAADATAWPAGLVTLGPSGPAPLDARHPLDRTWTWWFPPGVPGAAGAFRLRSASASHPLDIRVVGVAWSGAETWSITGTGRLTIGGAGEAQEIDTYAPAAPVSTPPTTLLPGVGTWYG